MAKSIRSREISSFELISAHLNHLQRVNQPSTRWPLSDSALRQAEAADRMLAAGGPSGPLHGAPFSVKDSMDVKGRTTRAGTIGRRNAPPATEDATLVRRLRAAGAIPIAKTNLPDLLFAFESDNFIFGGANNPYDLSRTPGGSSGGESALIPGEDGYDFTSPPVPVQSPPPSRPVHVAFFTYNGIARCTPNIENAIRRCADLLAQHGMTVEEHTPPAIDQAYELEMALLGADGCEGIDEYLHDAGSTQIHPLLAGFLDHRPPFRATASQLARRWA